jgi:hypothetical protein
MVSVLLHYFSYSTVGGGSIPNTRVRIRELYNLYILFNLFFLDAVWIRYIPNFCLDPVSTLGSPYIFNNVDSITFKFSLFPTSVWIRYFDPDPCFQGCGQYNFQVSTLLNSVWIRYLAIRYRYLWIRIHVFRTVDITTDIFFISDSFLLLTSFFYPFYIGRIYILLIIYYLFIYYVLCVAQIFNQNGAFLIMHVCLLFSTPVGAGTPTSPLTRALISFQQLQCLQYQTKYLICQLFYVQI